MAINLANLLRAAAVVLESDEAQRLEFLKKCNTLGKRAALELLARENAPASVIEHVRATWPD